MRYSTSIWTMRDNPLRRKARHWMLLPTLLFAVVHLCLPTAVSAEVDDTPSGATELTIGTRYFGYILFAGDEDWGKVYLTASQGILFTRNNNIQVQGNVRVVNDRYTLVAETLDYEHAQRRLSTDRPVTITGQAFVLSSSSMIYDLNTNQAQLDGNVKGIVHEKPAI